MSLDSGNDDLVQSSEAGSHQQSFADDEFCKTLTWRLPPKQLLPRSRRRFPRDQIFPILLFASVVVALPTLLSQLGRLNQHLHNDKSIPIFSTLPKAAMSSCDLIWPTGSAFEKAFTIDLRSNLHLSFATAKSIDVIWDLIVGQGGRLFLAWISYVVFMNGLARLMETSAISYQLYASLVFETSSLIATWQSLKAVSGHGWRGRAFFAWFGFATIYVLAYSTLISAATGYINYSTIRFRMSDMSLITPTSDELQNCLILPYGSLVGLADNDAVVGPSIYIGSVSLPSSSSYIDFN